MPPRARNPRWPRAVTLPVAVVVTLVSAVGAWAAIAGTRDATFTPPTLNSEVRSVATQPDGKVLIGGNFTNLGGDTATDRVARLLGGVPTASPTGVTALAGDGQASVSWTGVAGDITSYTATAAPGGATCTATAPATSCTVTGLAHAVAYTFAVTAANAFGAGPASAASAAVTTPAAAVTTPVATLTATVLPARARVVSGRSMRIHLRVANTGTATASSLSACLVIPTGLSVLTAPGGRRTGRTVCFRRATLAPGRTVTSQVSVRANATRTVVRRVTGSVGATDVARVLASPLSVTVIPRGR